MSYLIFDTETTGFPSKELPSSHPAQARIIQIAWLVLDEQFKEVSCFKYLVKSEGKWTISQGAQAAHGISQQDCDKYGEQISLIMPLFYAAFMNAKKVVAHNIRFDSQLIDIELNNHDTLKGEGLNWNGPSCVCTMNAMTPICKLPSKSGRAGYKWPKLMEAYEYCFKESFKGAHDALADVRATARVLKWLVDNRHVTL